jgi:hypothetical protein
MRTVLVIALNLCLAPAAGAQAPSGKADPAEVRALVSQYELASADNSRKCKIALEPKPAGPGFLLVFDRSQCSAQFGFLGEVAAWTPGIAGAILLIGRDGRAVAEFTEGVGGVYEAIRENDAVYFLANLQFVDPAERVQIADLYGEWVLFRPGGQPICRITLTDQIAGDELFAVRVQPNCDPTIERVGATTWQLERGDVVLRSSGGESLRFERQEGGIWAKVPDKPRPLLMSRADALTK